MCPVFLFYSFAVPRALPSFPTRRSSDSQRPQRPSRKGAQIEPLEDAVGDLEIVRRLVPERADVRCRSEEHTSELQSHSDLVCRLLLEKKKKTNKHITKSRKRQTQRSHKT